MVCAPGGREGCGRRGCRLGPESGVCGRRTGRRCDWRVSPIRVCSRLRWMSGEARGEGLVRFSRVRPQRCWMFQLDGCHRGPDNRRSEEIALNVCHYDHGVDSRRSGETCRSLARTYSPVVICSRVATCSRVVTCRSAAAICHNSLRACRGPEGYCTPADSSSEELSSGQRMDQSACSEGFSRQLDRSCSRNRRLQ